jgi:hypothetical protein
MDPDRRRSLVGLILLLASLALYSSRSISGEPVTLHQPPDSVFAVSVTSRNLQLVADGQR